MKTDAELKSDVISELKWDSSINETEIGVAVKDGIVTLTGFLSSYAQKMAAERATKRVLGVKAVVQEIEVKILSSDKRSDVDIAKAAVDSLKWNSSVPKDTVMVKVDDGRVTLEGSVKWNYQREAAKTAIQNLEGVKSVTNLVKIKSSIEPSDVKEKIKKTFERNALLDAENINISVDGHKVTLSGNIRSWDEEKQAKEAAWSAPGVWEVVDNLTIKSREMVSH